MMSAEQIAIEASSLNGGEILYLHWQRGLKSNLITELLQERLPERTFEVHETINGYSIKSI